MRGKVSDLLGKPCLLPCGSWVAEIEVEVEVAAEVEVIGSALSLRGRGSIAASGWPFFTPSVDLWDSPSGCCECHAYDCAACGIMPPE